MRHNFLFDRTAAITLFAFASLDLLCACQTVARVNPFKENELEVEALQQMTAQLVNQKPANLAIGDKLKIDTPTEFSAPGFYPMSIVPVEGGRNFLKVKLAKLPTSDAGDPQDNANLLLSEVFALQKLLAKGRGREALGSIESLQKTWPRVVMLDHLKASAFVILKDYSSALSVVDAALKKSPNSIELKELQATISRIRQ